MLDLKFDIHFEGEADLQIEKLVGNFAATYRADVMFENETQTLRYTIDIVNDKNYPEDEILLTNFYKTLFKAQAKNTIKNIDVFFKVLDENGEEVSESIEKGYQLLNIVQEGQIVGVHYRKDLRSRGATVGSLQLEYHVSQENNN